MGVLNISDLKTGMALAQDVLNKHGNILLKQGNILTEKQILILKSWGITETDIKDVDKIQIEKIEMESLSVNIIALVEQEVKELFPLFNNNPVMEEIYRIVKKIKLRQAVKRPVGEPDEIKQD